MTKGGKRKVIKVGNNKTERERERTTTRTDELREEKMNLHHQEEMKEEEKENRKQRYYFSMQVPQGRWLRGRSPYPLSQLILPRSSVDMLVI